MERFSVGDRVEVIGCWTLEGKKYIGQKGKITKLINASTPLGEKVFGAVLDIETNPRKGFDLIHLRKIPPDSDSKSYIHKDTLKLFDGRKVSNPDQVEEHVKN